MSITIRSARPDELKTIVAIHMRAFKGFFLTALGPGFLLELYRGFVALPDGRLLVGDLDGNITGFVAGTLDPRRFFRRLLYSRWLPFAWAAVGAAIRRPRAVGLRLLSAVLYRGDHPARLPEAALLSALAVDPHHSGRGIGALLVAAYCAEALAEGRRFVYLTTDRDANEATNRFYLRQGFVIESEIHRRNGRVMIRYVRALT